MTDFKIFTRARKRKFINEFLQILNTDVKQEKTPKSNAAKIVRTPGLARKRTRQTEEGVHITVLERVDVNALKFMVANVELLVKEERTKFLRYAAALLESEGAHNVTYQVLDYGYGRLYPDTTCLQGFSRPLRSTLVRDLMLDIDGSNMHPAVLMGIANENGWPCVALRHYLANREQILQSIPLERKLAKQLMLMQMYGGLVRNFIKDQLEKRTIVGTLNEWLPRIPHFVHQFGSEVRQMAERVPHVYPEVCEAAAEGAEKRTSNKQARALSILVQTREIEAVMAAIEFMQLRGWVVGVLMHDGFMVYKRDDEQVFINKLLLNGIKQTVKTRCNLEIDFEVKEFEEPYSASIGGGGGGAENSSSLQHAK